MTVRMMEGLPTDQVGGVPSVTCSDGLPCFNMRSALNYDAIQSDIYDMQSPHERVDTTLPLVKCDGLTNKSSGQFCSLVCRGANILRPTDSDAMRTGKVALRSAKDVLSNFQPSRHAAPMDEPSHPGAW